MLIWLNGLFRVMLVLVSWTSCPLPFLTLFLILRVISLLVLLALCLPCDLRLLLCPYLLILLLPLFRVLLLLLPSLLFLFAFLPPLSLLLLVFRLRIRLPFFLPRLCLLLWLLLRPLLTLSLIFRMLLRPLRRLLCLFSPLYPGGASAVVQGVGVGVPSSSSSSSSFLEVPPGPSHGPSPHSAYAGVPVSSAAYVVPVVPPPPVYDPLAHSAAPQFEDPGFDPDDCQFDDDTHFPDPSAPPLSLGSSRLEYRCMVEYVLGLFPQASGVPPSAPSPRVLFESFFADSTPSSPNLHFNWFDRVCQSLTDADTRMAAFLSSGRSDRVFLPSCHLSYAMHGDHVGAKAVPVNESLLAHFERPLRPNLFVGLSVRDAMAL